MACSLALHAESPTLVLLSQALNIPTKINKGTVEITSDVHLIVTGTKVGSSEATLLAKLGIKPFSYGLVVREVHPTYALPSCSIGDACDGI